MRSTREILITNDDGIDAEGIHVLAGIMAGYGNVTVVAPLHPQSGKSAALSMDTPLYLKQVKDEPGLREYTFNGTPVDCVKIGINECFPKGELPDIVVSGINHGANCSVASLYSGTLGACIEGTVYEIPSIGFSLCTHKPHPDFSPVLRYTGTIIEKFLEFPPDKDTRGRWVEEFDTHYDENGGKYFMMAGHFENHEKEGSDGDHWLVYHKYITVVPHRVDTTDYAEMERRHQATCTGPT